MTKTWKTMTTEEHIFSNAVTGAKEDASEAQRVYDETCERWQSECRSDGIDPEIEREYYQIDELKRRLDAAIARRDATLAKAIEMGIR